MTCPRCRKNIAKNATRCPYCGAANPQASGLFQTSTVLISADGADLVYRSVDEVPAGLRTRLLKSTNGHNSATILIADRRGRKEIARAMRKLPGNAQRRMVHSVLSGGPGGDGTGPFGWLTPGRRKGIAAGVGALALAVVAWLFLHHWTLWP